MPRVIKKYANRRLYDTAASQHVTLDGVRKLIVAGEDVEVREDATGEDITRNVLLQIIADQEQGGRPVLSTEMLRHIIRFYGNPMQEFMGRYLEQSMQAMLRQQQNMQEQFKKTMMQGPGASLQDMTKQNVEVWQQMQQAFFDAMNPSKKPD